jgi:hypothetical protein
MATLHNLAIGALRFATGLRLPAAIPSSPRPARRPMLTNRTSRHFGGTLGWPDSQFDPDLLPALLALK